MNKISKLSALLLMMFLAGCTEHQTREYSERVQAPSVEDAGGEELAIVSGVITEKMQKGKDGSVWQFIANDGKEYAVVISIPNLGPKHSENIDVIKPGAKVRIIGDSFMMGDERRLIATEIVVIH
ncbi:hypothetical protein [Endozoicomonas numazuensis]|uniref:Lipoprotein n=1 Tax=Endozoicomonas numazuensis TaxID=1137799 RepID=A0A081NGG0_9GAMM|nr:hypothetical protein [Endozoicomonas numazuensis]KEQ17533.1 hypothetical protein GZ78_17440 [Endozoicomonas numazuensis]